MFYWQKHSQQAHESNSFAKSYIKEHNVISTIAVYKSLNPANWKLDNY